MVVVVQVLICQLRKLTISPQLLSLEREVISSFLSSDFLMPMVRVIISQAIKLTQFTIHDV